MSLDPVLDLLRCPLCHAPFTRVERALRCHSGHSYDLARQGYANLLGRTTPAHADTAEMVAARARFLAGGWYDPISAAVQRCVHEALRTPHPPRVLEVGAGTGHYLRRLLDGIGGRGVALDISPAAARHAARAHPRLGAVVADVWAELPLPDGCLDVVLAVFAPRHPGEFARVLAPGGLLVVVTPEAGHLGALRAELGLLAIPAGKDEQLAAVMPAELAEIPGRPVHFVVGLGTSVLLDLVAMGPNAFHRSTAEIATQVHALVPPVAVTVAVRISAWRRR